MIQNALNYLEKLLRTDVRYAIKGFFWFGIEHSVSTLTGIASSVAFANLLLPETYGIFKYILSLLPFLGLSTLNKLDDSLTISVAKGFEGDIINVLKTKIKWGLLGSAAGLGLSLYYYFGGNQTLALLVAILAIFVPLFNTPLIYGNYLMGEKKFRTAAVINSTSSVIYSIAIIVAVLFSKNVFVIVLIYFIINTIVRFASFYYVIKKYPPNENKEEKTIDYGKKINMLEIINTISASIDNILVFHYLGAAELAAYTFIKKVPENLKFIPRFLTTLSTPKFSQSDIGNPKVKKEVVRKTVIFYSGMALIILAYILAAPFIFNLLFKPYKDYVLYSQIYAFSFALNFGGLYLNFLETTRRVRSVISLHLTTSLLSIIVMLVSLKFYGLLGLVVGYSIIRFLSSVIRYIYFKKAESVI